MDLAKLKEWKFDRAYLSFALKNGRIILGYISSIEKKNLDWQIQVVDTERYNSENANMYRIHFFDLKSVEPYVNKLAQ